jgi:hypothetical protein
MEELSNTPFVAEFQLVCVDPSPSRPALPRWLKSVPTIVVSGESSPRVGPNAVNNWLFERKQGSNGNQKAPQQALEERSAPLTQPTYSPDVAPRPDATSRTTAPPRGGAFPPAISSNTPANSSMSPNQANSEGPMAYHGSEMGSGKWSDNYSFVGGEAFSSEKGYNPIERNFESLVPVNQAGGRATAAPAPKRSMKEEKLLNDFQAYSAQRDRDIPGPSARQ